MHRTGACRSKSRRTSKALPVCVSQSRVLIGDVNPIVSVNPNAMELETGDMKRL